MRQRVRRIREEWRKQRERDRERERGKITPELPVYLQREPQETNMDRTPPQTVRSS